MQLLPWIKDDIAIEIIGKMIAEQTEQLYVIAAEYKQKGFPFDSQEVKTDPRYQGVMGKIGEFKREIDQIYDGEQVEKLHEKVDRVYVPHLNSASSKNKKEKSGVEKFFGDTVGFGTPKPTQEEAFYSGNQHRDDQAAPDRNDAGSASIKENIRH